MTGSDVHLARQGAYQDVRFSHQQSPIVGIEDKQNFISPKYLVQDNWDKDDAFENGQVTTKKRMDRKTNTKKEKSDSELKTILEKRDLFTVSAQKAEEGCSLVFPVRTKHIKNSSFPSSNNRKFKVKCVNMNSKFRDKNTETKIDNSSNEYVDVVTSTNENSVAEEQDAILQHSLTANKVGNAGISLLSLKHNNTFEGDNAMHASYDLILNDTLSVDSIGREESAPKSSENLSASENLLEDLLDSSPEQILDASSSESSLTSNQNEIVIDSNLPDDSEMLVAKEETDRISDKVDANVTPVRNSVSSARTRWRRLKNSMTVVNRMTTSKSSNYNLLEDSVDGVQQCPMYVKGDAGSMGAAAFEGVRTTARSRQKGRKGMEGLLVRQDKSFISFIQDFYVACLKIPILYFFIGVFLIPVALGLLFTPLYLLDINGLSFDGVIEDLEESPIASTRHKCFTLLNVFLYALSLSTTFGGSPVVAVSPFCLLVANTNTLMAQFLFVFLSGAVFARMSQPSQPIRCAKKAIIKTDDVTVYPEEYSEEKLKVFAVRLVLGGPTPCELVDVKICLTFRIFIKLPNGSTFCSTQDLDLVHPEVSYLRYGLMVRHVIDKKSPVYGHTLESLDEGDASFSLTIMGLERSSMQSIFHLEDYFVCDGDVAWDRDYVDFIHINGKGQRVLDHTKIDLLKSIKETWRDTQSGA